MENNKLNAEKRQKDFIDKNKDNLEVQVHSVPEKKGKYIVYGTKNDVRALLEVYASNSVHGLHRDIVEENHLDEQNVLGGGVMGFDRASGFTPTAIALVGESKDYGAVKEPMMNVIEQELMGAYESMGVNAAFVHNEPYGWYRR